MHQGTAFFGPCTAVQNTEGMARQRPLHNMRPRKITALSTQYHALREWLSLELQHNSAKYSVNCTYHLRY